VSYRSVNPATEEVLKTFTEQTVKKWRTGMEHASHARLRGPLVYALEELTRERWCIPSLGDN
jgi:hypothetical protein